MLQAALGCRYDFVSSACQTTDVRMIIAVEFNGVILVKSLPGQGNPGYPATWVPVGRGRSSIGIVHDEL